MNRKQAKKPLIGFGYYALTLKEAKARVQSYRKDAARCERLKMPLMAKAREDEANRLEALIAEKEAKNGDA